MTTTPKHTPTPLRTTGMLRGRGIKTRILDADGYEIAVATDPDSAAFIVLAVNNHEALVEAVKSLIASYIEHCPDADKWSNAIGKGRAAIAAVEGLPAGASAKAGRTE